MIKLITTNSYFNLFNLLKEELKGKVNNLSDKNLIFCEEKVSLMAERSIVSEFGGTLNTKVYSFGNYLRSRKTLERVLTKEGSSMAVKRILATVKLDTFKASKTGLAPALFDLIIQLKSAKVTVEDLETASQQCVGTLKSKLKDMTAVYKGYEEFIENGGLDDQSSMLSYLPEVIEQDQDIPNTDVYIVGFNGWTNQLRAGILALLKRARSVTAILVSGKNEMVFVGETERAFIKLCQDANKRVEKKIVNSDYTQEGELILDTLFNPRGLKNQKMDTNKVHLISADNKFDECDRVAREIRGLVSEGKCRYKEITVAVANLSEYREELERAFKRLEIPYFIDEKKKVLTHPLVRLLFSYVDAFRKNLERTTLTAFFKNPLFCEDKDLSDAFENYLLKYNINYSQIKKPFVFEIKGEYTLEQINEFRQKIVSCFESFDLEKLLKDLGVEEKITSLSEMLEKVNEREEKAINDQVYKKINELIGEMKSILFGIGLSLNEYKQLLKAGVSAMELSIIPQYNDAVFVGGFKETALAKADYLFAIGMTSEVPSVREDIALLSDGDIGALEEIKVMVEPKIKVVNHRTRENLGLALSAFKEKLFVSYPVVGVDGAKTVKSEAFTLMEKLFNTKPLKERWGYDTYKDGLNSFAKDCGAFADGRIKDFSLATAFYSATNDQDLNKLLERSHKQVKTCLSSGARVMERNEVSPTKIEDYYKCPYRAFLANGLRLKRREEGVVDGFSIGNLMHEIFCEYAMRMSEVKDRETSDKLVLEIKDQVVLKPDYSRFIEDASSRALLENAVKECAKFCYKNYLAICRSEFKVKKTEATIGMGQNPDYPALSLCGGKVKMTGKIDRIDESEKYFRIMDYKTASASAKTENLFNGKKLQLYLYASAITEVTQGKKELAGVYYMPVNDDYREENAKDPSLAIGATLDERESVEQQDKEIFETNSSEFLPVGIEKTGEMKIDGLTSKQELSARVKYAKAMAEQAVEQMTSGVIVPSPCDERVCTYCEFLAFCERELPPRSLKKIDDQVFVDAMKGGDE